MGIADEFDEFFNKYYVVSDEEKVRKKARKFPFPGCGHSRCIKKFYNDNARLGELVSRTHFNLNLRSTKLAFTDQKGLIEKSNTIVDFGSSIGSVCNFLACKFPEKKIIGIDFAGELWKIAEEYKKKIENDRGAPLSNLEFLLSDVKDTGLDEKSCDLVMIWALEEHDRPNVYKEARRILKPGGYISLPILNEAQLMYDDQLLHHLKFKYKGDAGFIEATYLTFYQKK